MRIDFKYIKTFGILMYGFKLLEKRGKCRRYTQKKIEKFLEKNVKNVIAKYKNIDCQNKVNSCVWIFWWQGSKNLPNVVEKCINQYDKLGINYVLIDKYNYVNYIDIDSLIIKKVEDGSISLANFSDLIRMKLLSKYGGIWADATIFISENRLHEIVNKDFYTPKLYEDNWRYVSNNRWCIFFIGGSNVKYFGFLSECLELYMKKYDYNIDYFLLDYFIDIAYNNFDEFKKLIDNNCYNNTEIFKLNKLLNQSFNKEEYEMLKKNVWIHKLSYKQIINDDINNFFYNI